MYIFYNGSVIDDTTLSMNHHNRAFSYGDGLFETIIYEKNQLKFEQFHKERLLAGMSAMSLVFAKKTTIDSIFSGLHQLVQKEGHQSARVRLQVWRTAGGLYTPKNSQSEVLAICTPLELNESLSKKIASFSSQVKLNATNWSAFKTISAMHYVQAGIEKQQRNLDELILLDHQGYISECTSSNIFWKTGDSYYTPSLKTGCISGIMRRHIINQLNEYPIELNVGEYLKEELLKAEEIFTCNVTGIHPITSIDEQQYTNTLSIIPLLEL